MDKRQLFARRLRELRKTKGLTQKELGRRLNVTEAAVGMWEQARRLPDPEVLSRLAGILGVSVDYLLGNPQPDPSTPWWERDAPPADIELEEFIRNQSNLRLMGNPLDEEAKEDVLLFLRTAHEHIKKDRERKKAAREAAKSKGKGNKKI
ncbi:MAG: helix-turn-helix domain-containing protein [Peptococcaceae bacterium]|nr:helix-turn-helix domain-containing protein [Peptococcaceae bacterium]